MEVPFDKLGPGQSGRFVYQVMGNNGPIFNPNNIRFMAPGGESNIAPDPSGLIVGLAGVNLATSIGVLAISAATYNSLQKLHGKMDTALYYLSEINVKIDEISKRVKRIDIRVAENNLREALKHTFKRAISMPDIDLKKLSLLSSDLESFMETVEGGVVGNFGVKISSDVRDNLSELFSLMRGVRLLVAVRHNRLYIDNPEQILATNKFKDYLEDVGNVANGAILMYQCVDKIKSTNEIIQKNIDERFSFSDEEDQKHFEELMSNTLFDGQMEAFDFLPISKFFWDNIPDEIFNVQDGEELNKKIIEIAKNWLWGTDSGLIWRTYLELEANKVGYNNMFWSEQQLEKESKLEEINVDCEFKLE